MIVAIAAQAYGGPQQLIDNADDVLSVLGKEVFGEPLDKILIIAVLTSAAASTQTTILPTARTSLSMARSHAMPRALGDIHPRYLTPHVSTILMGVLSIVWYVGLTIISENILFDSIAALGLMIAFYYGITGFACTIYYRRELFRSVKTFLLIGVGPFLGGLMLLGIFVKSCVDLSKPENSESGDSWFGLGPPLVIGLGFLLLGVVLMLFWRMHDATLLPPQARGRGPGPARPERRMSGPIVLGYDGTEGARPRCTSSRGSRRCSAPRSSSRSATRRRRWAARWATSPRPCTSAASRSPRRRSRSSRTPA